MITKDTKLKELAYEMLSHDNAQKEYEEFLANLERDSYAKGLKDAFLAKVERELCDKGLKVALEPYNED